MRAGDKYRVQAGRLSEAVRDVLREERDDLAETVEGVVADTSERLRGGVAERAGSLFGGTGAYARGWTASVNRSGLDSAGVVYNGGKHAGLAHLLENGHAVFVPKRQPGGGYRAEPTGRRVEGRKHIGPAFDDAVRYMDKRLRDEI